jgi:hypothetical protein
MSTAEAVYPVSRSEAARGSVRSNARPMPSEPVLDILHNSGHQFVVVASVRGFTNAKQKIDELSKGKPGKYVIWDAQGVRTLARIDTTP